MTSAAEQRADWSDDDVSTDELARRQGVAPAGSIAALARPDLWDSDQDYAEFLADLYASRHTEIA